MSSVKITPAASSISAGNAISFTATASDIYGNSWDVTSATTWGISSGAGGSWTGNIYVSSASGSWTVTGIYASTPYTTTVTVNPGTVDHYVLSTNNNEIAGTAFYLTVTAKDSFGNTVTGFTGNVSLASSGTVSPATSGNFASGTWTGLVTLSFSGTLSINATDSSGHSGTSIAITVSAPFSSPTPSPSSTPTSTPSPTPTPTPSPTANSTVQATIQATFSLTLSGNITSTQMTNVTITPNQPAGTTAISFNVTGVSGTVGFGNMTIPKSAVPYGTTPIVYIDGQPAADQGFTQDADNYYVWYTTHFSSHNMQILFSGKSTTNGDFITDLLPIAIIALLAVALAATAAVAFRRGKHKRPKNIFFFSFFF